MMRRLVILLMAVVMLSGNVFADGTVKIGLNYPMTGPYSAQGLDEKRGTEIAVEEINAAGGILGKKIEIISRNSKSQKPATIENVNALIDEGVKMIFGGVSSGVAVEASEICQKRGIIFMGTITASNVVTGKKAHRNTFRGCYNAWMGAKALGMYLRRKHSGKKYFFITADYTWGRSSEESLRKFTGTHDKQVHKGVKTPFPGATDESFRKALSAAKLEKPDVLVLVLFGSQQTKAISIATEMGLKDISVIMVPILELAIAEGAGPKVMEGVIGTADFVWQVPYKYDYKKGIDFVKKFKKKYNRYPCWGASSAYKNLTQYKEAVERAGNFNTADVVKALEGHKFTMLKDEEYWRDFDHQAAQSVYIVKCKSVADVMKDPLKLDYFEVLAEYKSENVLRTRAEWNKIRKSANKSIHLEPFK